MEPLPKPPRGKMERKLALSERALRDLDAWQAQRQTRVSSVSAVVER